MAAEKIKHKELRHDKLLDFVSSGAWHLQKHRKVYISLLALLVVAGIVLAAVYYRGSQRRKQVAALLNRSRGAASLVEISRKYPGTPSAPLALLSLAGIYYREEKFAEAGKAYQLFLSRYPDHGLAPFAAMGMAYCRESEGDRDDAIAQYRLIGQKYPQSCLVAESIFNVGRCQLELNRTKEAVAAYEEVLSLHPESFYARLAREQLVKLASEAEEAEAG